MGWILREGAVVVFGYALWLWFLGSVCSRIGWEEGQA